MTDNSVFEFEKNPLTSQSKSIRAFVEKQEKLGVGGGEGEKFFYVLVHPEKMRPFGKFVSKQHEYSSSYVKSVVNAYSVARKEGFLVPTTTRYFEENGKKSILMSDMTENGKWLVWGFNDFQTSLENETLIKLNINHTDIIKIEKDCQEFVKKAEVFKRKINFYNYHVRKDLQNGKVQVFLLDLSDDFSEKFDHPQRKEKNEANAQLFIKLVSSVPDELSKVYSQYSRNL